VGEGFISVTPLHLDMTGEDFLEALEADPPGWINGDRVEL
jgi:hypothetical protein